MNTFKEGDRVIHKTYGEGTVVFPYEGLSSITVEFDTEGKIMTDKSLLTPVPSEPKFKIGDRVRHPLHRDGTVEEIQDNGLHVINIGGNRVYMALAHQIGPANPEPKFTVQVMFTDGGGLNSDMPLTKPQAEGYLTQLPDWDTVESITITRAKG